MMRSSRRSDEVHKVDACDSPSKRARVDEPPVIDAREQDDTLHEQLARACEKEAARDLLVVSYNEQRRALLCRTVAHVHDMRLTARTDLSLHDALDRQSEDGHWGADAFVDHILTYLHYDEFAADHGDNETYFLMGRDDQLARTQRAFMYLAGIADELHCDANGFFLDAFVKAYLKTLPPHEELLRCWLDNREAFQQRDLTTVPAYARLCGLLTQVPNWARLGNYVRGQLGQSGITTTLTQIRTMRFRK